MRTTITINDRLLHRLKQRALDSDETVSSIIEQAVVQQLLEDMEDIEAARQADSEAEQPLEALVAEFRAEGLIG